MFGLTRWNPYQDLFTFQREVDRLFNQFWSDLPARTTALPATSFQVQASDDGWRIEVPLPGIAPERVSLDVTGHTLNIRAHEPGDDKGAGERRVEQTLTLPQFLDLDRVVASHRHGMLHLTVPFKESVKPRRIQITTTDEPARQLTAA